MSEMISVVAEFVEGIIFGLSAASCTIKQVFDVVVHDRDGVDETKWHS